MVSIRTDSLHWLRITFKFLFVLNGRFSCIVLNWFMKVQHTSLSSFVKGSQPIDLPEVESLANIKAYEGASKF